MDLPNPVLKPAFSESPELQADPLPLSHWKSLYNRSKNCKSLCWTPGFPGGSDSKESARNVGDLGSISELGRYPREGHVNLLEYSCLENPHGQRSLAGYSPWNSPGQNTGVGSLSLLQGIFPTQKLNPGLLHCRQMIYEPSYEGRPQWELHWTYDINPFWMVLIFKKLSLPTHECGISFSLNVLFFNNALSLSDSVFTHLSLNIYFILLVQL